MTTSALSAPDPRAEAIRLHDDALRFSRQGSFSIALHVIEAAYRLDPNDPHVATTYATELLRNERFDEAWTHYNRRSAMYHVQFNNFQTLARFNPDHGEGSAVAWLEQGLGDQILFSQLVPSLPGDVVVVAADERLNPLLRRSFPAMQFMSQIDQAAYTLPGYDYQIPIADMPGRSPGCFPRTYARPYLFADLDQAYVRRGAYQRELANSDQKIIGCSWRTTSSKMEKQKSCHIGNWEPLWKENALFLSLQHSLMLDETFNTPLRMDDTLNVVQDIDGLASAIWACDGIVTTSNTIAHLASALGRPTLVMAPFADGLLWYWGLKEHSAFYPDTTRIVRCARPDDWSHPIAEAGKFIAEVPHAWQATTPIPPG